MRPVSPQSWTLSFALSFYCFFTLLCFGFHGPLRQAACVLSGTMAACSGAIAVVTHRAR